MLVHAAWTDAVLAMGSLVVGALLLVRGGGNARTGGIGLMLVGVAAVVGTLRFSGLEHLAPAHAGLSGLAACVGLPCIGAGWATLAFAPERADAVRRGVFGLLLVVAAMVWWVPLVRTVLGGAGMLAVILACARLVGVDRVAGGLGATGALLTLLVGLVIGTDGVLLGFPRVGWFHLGLAVANVALGWGLLRLDPQGPEGVGSTGA